MIHPWQKDPIIKDIVVRSDIPVVTIVMPVYNQKNIIKNVLKDAFSSIGNMFDFILVNDGSIDGTDNEIQDFIKKLEQTSAKLCRFTIINNLVPIYETGCDNLGFRKSRTEYIIEVQSDIFVRDKNFDIKMIEAMNIGNLGTVSGRHVHSFALIDNWSSWIKYPCYRYKFLSNKFYDCAGLIGDKLFMNKPVNVVSKSFYIAETCARGPWLLRKSDLEFCNYLDEENFFLGNDDHDLNRKLYQNQNKYAGYVPINIISNRYDGSTRKKRQGLNLDIYVWLLNNKKGSIEFREFIKNYKPYRSTECINIGDLHVTKT